MNYEIVELENFSGNKTTVYSVMLQGEDITLFDHFVQENVKVFRAELKSIIAILEAIGYKTGARETFFKLKEGTPGDLVAALYDDPDSKLRLYCIKFGSAAIILGGGGPKPSHVISWQDDEKLTAEATKMIKVSGDILQKLSEGDLNGRLMARNY